MKRTIQKLDSAYKPFRLNSALYLKELKSTFEHIGIPSVYYSLNGYSEDAICIECNNNMWMVYNGERGNKYNINKYNNVKNACDNMILRLSESEEERKQIQIVFEKKLKEYIIRHEHARVIGDTDSLEAQTAILIERILELTEKIKEDSKDHNSRRDRLKLIGRRRSLLDNLKKEDINSYHNMVEMLGLRR